MPFFFHLDFQQNGYKVFGIVADCFNNPAVFCENDVEQLMVHINQF
jgi:hypothetical protein